ncbi:DNA adenine methylase [Planococcus halotolerans]|uniref:DNA adenine methylase n=1 Tax=Planococcus halotolerans TaxID=2233542 RepID=UPI0010928CF4|nr:DNA adenine methylase [Planococcus halotolerans]QHJ69223.1 hypothetical protein DNR44_000565 [Planococcus halotolerans]
MAVRFIGNKQKLLSLITNKIIEKTGLHTGTFVDLFTGTTSVAMAFKKLGFNVISNDKLESSFNFSKAGLLINKEPQFHKLLNEVEIPFNSLFEQPYDLVLDYLNSLPEKQEFFYKEYSPQGSAEHLEEPRKYFTDYNAKKIDAIRTEINYWFENAFINDNERALLLSSLMFAVNKVANISGTYGAYLKNWYPRALDPLKLCRYPLFYSNKRYEVYNEDANNLVKKLAHSEIVYIDPPYTKRQYNAYYHILETLAYGDNPELLGKTGQRAREAEEVSAYCYKKKAPDALLDLITNIKADHVFLSYSTDGHISHQQIMDILSTRGTPEYWAVDFKRFKSNNPKEKNGSDLKELLYYVKVI